MGIKNFFQEFDRAKRAKNISEYKGQRCAIDGYVWMHQALYARQTDFKEYKKVDRFVGFFKVKIDRLLTHNIKITIVWDGAKHPMKQRTNIERYLIRKRNYKEAIRKYKMGLTNECLEDFKKAISITPGLVHSVQKQLEEEYSNQINFITAPYEADSQLVYLNQNNFVDFIISIDSDLMVFGAKNVFYKMDHYFNGEEYTQDRVLDILKQLNGQHCTLIDLIKICILRGCDYLDSPLGIGFKTALKLYKKYNDITQIISATNYNFPDNYLIEYYKSYMTFRFMWVYCPTRQAMVQLNNNPTMEDRQIIQYIRQNIGFQFMGEKKQNESAVKIATGQIDPITQTSFIQEFKLLYKINKNKTKNNQNFDISFSIILSELEKQFLNDYNQNKSRDDSILFDDRKQINHELLMCIMQNRQTKDKNISQLAIEPINKINRNNQTNQSQDFRKIIRQLDSQNNSFNLQNTYSSFDSNNCKIWIKQFKKFNFKKIDNLENKFKKVRINKQKSKDDTYYILDDDYQISFLLDNEQQEIQKKTQIDVQKYDYFSFQNQQNQNIMQVKDEFAQDLQKCFQKNFQLTNNGLNQYQFQKMNKQNSIFNDYNDLNKKPSMNMDFQTFNNQNQSQQMEVKISKDELKIDPVIKVVIQKEILQQFPELTVNITLKQIIY